jgi:DNA polymerase-3 subunit alpha
LKNQALDGLNADAQRQHVVYDHPILEPILKETNGVFIFQEQRQEAVRRLAGFSLDQDEVLQREKFIVGCEATHKISPRLAAALFDRLTESALYSQIFANKRR